MAKKLSILLKLKKTDRLWSKFLKKKIIKFRVFHQKELTSLKKSNKNIVKKTLASKKIQTKKIKELKENYQ